jgi:WD40 repeat protein
MNLTGHEGRVSSVSISPDGQSLLSGSWDTFLRVWTLLIPFLPFVAHPSSSYSSSDLGIVLPCHQTFRFPPSVATVVALLLIENPLLLLIIFSCLRLSLSRSSLFCLKILMKKNDAVVHNLTPCHVLSHTINLP